MTATAHKHAAAKPRKAHSDIDHIREAALAIAHKFAHVTATHEAFTAFAAALGGDDEDNGKDNGGPHP